MQRINANVNSGIFVTTKKFIAPMQLLLPPNQTLCYAASFNLCNKNELIFRLSGGCDTCFELLLTRFTLLKAVLLFYKTHSQNQTILAKTYTQKHVFCPKIQRYALYLTPFIKLKTAISTISPFYFAIFMKFLSQQKQL